VVVWRVKLRKRLGSDVVGGMKDRSRISPGARRVVYWKGVGADILLLCGCRSESRDEQWRDDSCNKGAKR
jgi:hypothetical protein